MRPLLFSFFFSFFWAAAAACSRPAPPAPAGTVFTKAAAAVGQVHRRTAELSLKASFDGGGAIATHERSTRTEEILAVAAGVPTKKKVTVEVESKAPTTETVEGEGAADPVTTALPDAPLARGEKVDAIARAIAGRLKGMEVTGSDVTFEGPKGDDGAFAVAMKLAKTEGGAMMTISLRGKLLVSTKTGAPTSLRLEGPVTLSITDAATELHGEGTVTIAIDEK